MERLLKAIGAGLFLRCESAAGWIGAGCSKSNLRVWSWLRTNAGGRP